MQKLLLRAKAAVQRPVHAVAFAILCAVALFPAVAYAQVTPPPPLSPNIALWLGVSALAIHVLLGALQSNTINTLLAQFTLPPIPSRAFPWLGVALGLGAGLVQALQAGDTIAQSIAAAIVGMLGGGATALHLNAVTTTAGERAQHAIAAMATVRLRRSLPPPPPPPTPKVPLSAVSTMIIGVVAILILSGCTASLWQQIESTVETDIENGTALSAIEAIVVSIDPALATIAGAADAIIQDVINYLEANGTLTPAQVTNAESVKAQIKAKLAALSAADRALLRDRVPVASPELVRVVARELAR